MSAYYNESDPFCAEWLRNLIAEGHIAPGDVDERDVRDVVPADLAGYRQVHLFAGIGGWSYALRLAGWPDDRAVWTGSCPCQPFSSAGGRDGFADERHLWPAMFHLVDALRPPVVLGEQVASRDGLVWLDLVSDDLAGAGYAVGAVDLAACGVGAPHIRNRLYWLGDADLTGSQGRGRGGYGADERAAREAGLDDSWREVEWLPCSDGLTRPTQPGLFPLAHGIPGRVGRLRAWGNAIVPQLAAAFVAAWESAA